MTNVDVYAYAHYRVRPHDTFYTLYYYTTFGSRVYTVA